METIRIRGKTVEIKLRVVIRKMLNIMRNHVGRGNSIQRETLFAESFGFPLWHKDIDTFRRMGLIEKFNRLRRIITKRTKCFILGYVISGKSFYYVINSKSDLKDIAEHHRNCKDGLDRRLERATRSIREKWYIRGKQWKYDE